GGVDAARNLVEYANHPGGTYYSDMRRRNGAEAPFKIKTWCLGNEMDGPWQIGSKTAEEYGRLAAETAKVMKWVDPEIELVVCGSSGPSMPTFASWEATVLEHTYDYVDYLSLHSYYGNQKDNLKNYLAMSEGMDRFIKSVAAICDYVKAKKKSDKVINLSFDEWNIWYHSNEKDSKNEPWQQSPPILEDVYNFEDTLLLGCLLITLLKNCDRVKIACIAQLVNVIAPIMTEKGGKAWRQTIFYPFMQAANHGHGTVLRHNIAVASYDADDYKAVPFLEAVSIFNSEKDEVIIFAVNRSVSDNIDFSLALQGFTPSKVLEFSEISGFDVKKVNDKDCCDVIPQTGDSVSITEHQLNATLKPLSFNLLRIKV
ncbi:MAG: alpha-N-arabinofuranosidase, partial [Lachnospiraceae bacterium]|nr:alpha-N-arabinofuranosidase [Lachnospiraceae bacterium]